MKELTKTPVVSEGRLIDLCPLDGAPVIEVNGHGVCVHCQRIVISCCEGGPQ